MTKFVLRKLGGEERICVARQKLAELLGAELWQCSAAIQTGKGASTFVGNDLEQVMQRVEGEVAKGAAEVEVLLIPPVAGGQPSPGYIDAVEAMRKSGGEFHARAVNIPDELTIAESLLTVDHIFAYFDELESAEVRLFVDGYRRVMKEGPDLQKADFKDLYEYEHLQAYLGVLRMDSGRQFYLDGLKLGGEAAVRELVEACSDALWSNRKLTVNHVKELAERVARSWRESERKSIETLRRTLGDEVAEELLREKRVRVRSRNGVEYEVTADGEVFVPNPKGAPKPVCVQVKDEGRLPKYDRVLAKYLVIRDKPEQIGTLREALEHCARCLREINLGDVHAAVTLEEEVFVEGEEGRGHDVDVTDAEALCLLCSECYRELKSRGAFGRIEELLSGPQYMAVLIQEEYSHEFVGVDVRVHGPFRRGEVACLPRANAELMVRRGEARKLEMLEEGKTCPICERMASRTGTEEHSGGGDGG